MTEYQPYGVRHFLRRLDAEGASELRVRPVPLRNGRVLDKGATANIDDFDQAALHVYRTLVLRRSPADSRPPSDYRLVSSGRWYDVWQRDAAARQVLEHLPLGDGAQPAAVPDCSQVERLARVAGPDGRLAAVERPATVVVPTYGAMGDVTVDVPVGGPYGIWMGGSIRNRLQTAVDGEPLSDVRHHLDYPGQYTLLGMAELAAGEHVVTLRALGWWSAPRERCRGESHRPARALTGDSRCAGDHRAGRRRATALRQAARLGRGAGLGEKERGPCGPPLSSRCRRLARGRRPRTRGCSAGRRWLEPGARRESRSLSNPWAYPSVGWAQISRSQPGRWHPA